MQSSYEKLNILANQHISGIQALRVSTYDMIPPVKNSSRLGAPLDRQEVISHIAERYGVAPDYPWPRWPGNAVFRHRGNRKWFGILMDVPAPRLGLAGEGKVDVLNVKVDPDDVAALKLADFILPAYHMNKENWVSVLIEGGVPDGVLADLLETSHRLTG